MSEIELYSSKMSELSLVLNFCHDDMKPKRIDAGDDNEITLPLSKSWVNEQYFSSAVTENAGERCEIVSRNVESGKSNELRSDWFFDGPDGEGGKGK